jgi:hypothetical protein
MQKDNGTFQERQVKNVEEQKWFGRECDEGTCEMRVEV